MPGSFLIRVRNRGSMKVEVEVRVRVEHSCEACSLPERSLREEGGDGLSLRRHNRLAVRLVDVARHLHSWEGRRLIRGSTRPHSWEHPARTQDFIQSTKEHFGEHTATPTVTDSGLAL